ncbi:MAG: PAS domain-containing sensor histidine kinase [Actinomycetota bacterium]|nr:PAS domain-containing sensor histidine kinase [Actinomycetota bacterium]
MGRTATLAPDKAAYDELPDGVLVADAIGRVAVLNPAGERLLRRSADEVLGHDYREVLPLVDGAGRDWWACTRPYDGLDTRTSQPERRLTLQDEYAAGADEGRELLVTARFVRDEHRRLVRLVVAFRDSAAAERQGRSQADLVSTVAHELRSPLTSVKGFTATLLAKWERFNDEQKKLMLQTVNADADRVTRLLSELLDVSRIDAGRLELHRQVVDVPAAVEKVFAGRVASGDEPDRFVLDARGPLPEMWLDPDKLQQVLGNLVENALRHGAGIVTVRVAPAGDGALVTVTDEGEGVPAEALARVFTKFWRSGRRGGTGLGLYVVKGLTEAHGGSVDVGSGPAGGASFRLMLPAGQPSYLA